MNEKKENLNLSMDSINFFEQRLALCPKIIEEMLEHPVKDRPPILSKNFIVTGIGSSEAHARFFVDLVNRYTTSHATFLHIVNFYNNNFKKKDDSTLVVFSQGLSPNAELAINQRHNFKHLILFTGKIDPSNLILQKLRPEEQTIIEFPVPEEKGLLIRIVGPLCGYLSVIQFINLNWNNCLPVCEKQDLLKSININKSLINTDFFSQHACQGIVLLMGSPLCEYSQNLAYKFLEGLFLSMPSIVDYLSLAHGPLQQLINNPKLVIHLKSLPSSDLCLKSNRTIEQTTSDLFEITSKLPAPFHIFEYEMILNYLILAGMKEWKIDQINWPGKGLDIDLYKINKGY